MSADYRLAITRDVEGAIYSINAIVVLLQGNEPARYDVIDMNFTEDTVEAFVEYSQAVVDYLNSASISASLWLADSGERMSENLCEARRIHDEVLWTISQGLQMQEYTDATLERMQHLRVQLDVEEENLETAQKTLSHAEHSLRRKKNVRRGLRIGALATLFVPVVSIALVAVDATVVQQDINSQRKAVRTVKAELASSRKQLEDHEGQLLAETTQISLLSLEMDELEKQQQRLVTERAALQEERETLAVLAVGINECLHAVGGAYGSSVVISSMRSMRNVLDGIQGVVEALGQEEMFDGPVALLNEAGIRELDSQVAAIKRHKLMI
ncbi:hypothetical protein BD413DRAFT_641504 [Trametes elegans]|nr:hypothetical protein BD413DRAFT_641504 [Trametes elegans]